MQNFDVYLNPTEIIDSDHPSIIEYAKKKTDNLQDDISKACALFVAVRDEIKYDPLTYFYLKSHYQASQVLERKSGYCISKSCLLCALSRAVNIPSRLGLADIRNYGASQEIVELMGTNIFTYHGFVELFLNDRWVKATPAFDQSVYPKHNIPVVSFDGHNDAVFPTHDLNGNLYVEYIQYHGAYADLPLEDLVKGFREIYGDERVNMWIEVLESRLADEKISKIR